MRIVLASLIIVASLTACRSQETESPNSISSGTVTVVATPTPNVTISIVGGTSPEYRQYTTEVVSQNNCGGTAEVDNVFEKNRNVVRTIEAGSELSVSASGAVKLAGTGVELGTEVAGSLGYTYGVEETIGRSLTVKAKPQTKMRHTIALKEVWQIGTAQVMVGEDKHDIPFSFRDDFMIELIDSEDEGCASEIEFTPTQEAQPTLPPQETVTSAPTEDTTESSPEAEPSETVIASTPTSSAAVSPTKIQVTGFGAADPSVENESIKRQIAFRLATSEAVRTLTEWTGNAEVAGVTIVENSQLVTDTIRIILQQQGIPPYKVVEEIYDEETETATVTIELIVSE